MNTNSDISDKKFLEIFRKWAEKNKPEILKDADEFVKSEYWDLEQYRPMITVYYKNGSYRYFLLYDDEWIEETELIDSSDEYEWILSLDDGSEIYGIPYCLYDSIRYDGNPFCIIIPLSDSHIKISGRFIDNTAVFWIPYEDMIEEEYEELTELLNKHMNEILEIFMGYEWKPSDVWRGRFDQKKPENGWKKLIEGWVGLGTYHNAITLLAKIERMKVDSLPDYPILFVFPRSSNICVTYFDVYVQKDYTKAFLEYLKRQYRKEYGEDMPTDDFSFRHGYDWEVKIK